MEEPETMIDKQELKSRQLIYVAHPVSPAEGETVEENLADAKAWVRRLTLRYPEHVFIAPWITGVEMFDDSDPGLRADALDRLARTVHAWHESGEIVGAELLVVKNRRTVLHETVGWRDRDEHRPMKRHPIVNIRSMTKPPVAASRLSVVDAG